MYCWYWICYFCLDNNNCWSHTIYLFKFAMICNSIEHWYVAHDEIRMRVFPRFGQMILNFTTFGLAWPVHIFDKLIKCWHNTTLCVCFGLRLTGMRLCFVFRTIRMLKIQIQLVPNTQTNVSYSYGIFFLSDRPHKKEWGKWKTPSRNYHRWKTDKKEKKIQSTHKHWHMHMIVQISNKFNNVK